MSRFILKGLLFLSIFALLSLPGCSGGDPVIPEMSEDDSTVVLSLQTDGISGDLITYALNSADVTGVAALSLRLGFDESSMEPVDVEWSASVEGDAVFQLLDQPGFIPLAYASSDLSSGLSVDGELCSITFRILDPENPDAWIITDPDYLVAYSAERERLTLTTGGDSQ